MTILPDKKLFTKTIITEIVISVLIIISALPLAIFIPMAEKAPADEVAVIVWSVAGGTIALMWLIWTPIAYLWIKNLKYEIEPEKIIIHKGILSKIEKSIPYRAVTDFVLHRSLFDRFLGIASIRVQTAGQSQTATGYEGNLSGVLKWNEIHSVLKENLAKIHSSALTVTDSDEVFDLGGEGTLRSILEELREVRRLLESR